ncbi:aldehyde dehydrogenase family protein, partial [Escherichia coli]|nr:aldehyde dehydrogenase family protein [Escherichia coli]
TALAEQVADAVVQSAFRSTGQRCSALRLLLVHERIADGVMKMIGGAMQELVVGDPVRWATDVGPVIDAEAHANLVRHVQRLEREARALGYAQARLLAMASQFHRALQQLDRQRVTLGSTGVTSSDVRDW